MGMGEGLRFYKALMPWGGAEVSEPWLGLVGSRFVFLFFLLAVVVEIVVTLSFEKFANEK